jgi:hypothetical protein
MAICLFLPSSITQAVFVMSPGSQQFLFFLCTNKFGSSELNSSSFKKSKLMITTTVISLLVHLVLNLRIKIYKHRKKNLVFDISGFEHVKNLAISSIDSQALSDFGTSAVTIVLLGLSHFFTNRINTMNPERANEYPFYIFLYIYYFFASNVTTGFISLTYYIRHPPLRNAIYREIKSIFKISR